MSDLDLDVNNIPLMVGTWEMYGSNLFTSGSNLATWCMYALVIVPCLKC